MPFNRGEPRKDSLISRATANHTHQLYAPKWYEWNKLTMARHMTTKLSPNKKAFLKCADIIQRVLKIGNVESNCRVRLY
jgi:hypothetical protein